jgi:hypothetical protein
LRESKDISSTIVDIEKAITLAENNNILVAITVNITTGSIESIESTGSSTGAVVRQRPGTS